MENVQQNQSIEQIHGAIDGFIGRIVSTVSGLGNDLKGSISRIAALEARIAELEAAAGVSTEPPAAE
jgi:hypothetical protein